MKNLNLKLILAVGLVIASALTSPVRAEIQFEGTETQLTADLADQYDPAISGAYTVYTDRRGTDTDIYLYDIDAAIETQITSGGGDQMLNDVSGDLVVYTDYGSGNADIYLYNIFTEETTQLTDDPNAQRNPAISGNRVVFDDNRNGNYDIYMIDVSTMIETQLTTDSNQQIRPAINGSIVVWEDFRNGNYDIYMLDMDTSIETQLTDAGQQRDPDVDGDVIVFTSNAMSVGDIYLYRISAGQTTAVTSGADYETNPAVSGDYISYEGYSTGDADIWLYSISLGESRQATTDTNEQYLHDLSGNRLVYTDNRNDNLDIYLFEFVFDELPDGPSRYDLSWRTIDAGGGTSSDGQYIVTGTIGQHDAAYSAGGDYELLGGFWPGAPLCTVDFEHFARFAEYWLESGSGLPADLYGDDTVDLLDLDIFVHEWLYYCPYAWPLK